MKGGKSKGISPEELKNALYKKALGYDAKEIVEEYACDSEGEVKLSKKKVTVKNVPPDISALKILIDGEEKDLSEYSDEQLKTEKERLMKILANELKGEKSEKKRH